MKKYFFLLMLLYLTNITSAQDKLLVFDTTINPTEISNSKYYAKTNFNFIDSLNIWRFKIDTALKGKETDSVKPIGLLIFWRSNQIDDSISKAVYGKPWTPYITFGIFNLADTNYCYQKSTRTRFFSSCVPPKVGGDIIKIGKFILLNTSVCVNCMRYTTKVDYCRPVINNIFKSINSSEVTTLENLSKQFKILEGDLPDVK